MALATALERFRATRVGAEPQTPSAVEVSWMDRRYELRLNDGDDLRERHRLARK